MSNIAMQRQIHRLKTDINQIKPRAPVKYQLIGAPNDDASDEAKATYRAELEAAQAAGAHVIRLVGVRPDPIRRGWSRSEDRRSSL